MVLPPPAPEAGASTDSATSAKDLDDCLGQIPDYTGEF